MSNKLREIRQFQRKKYEIYKKEEKKKLYSSCLINFSNDEIEKIIDNNYIEKIQNFYRKYRLSDKECSNIEQLLDYNSNDIIKNRSNKQIYGYHYLSWQKHFDIRGYSDIKTDYPLNLQNIQRINKLIKQKTNFKYEIMANFKDYNCLYNENYSGCWDFSDIFNILEDRGIQKIKVPQSIFDEMLSFDPDVYALEVITNDVFNINKSYCIFNDFPIEDEDNILTLPIGVYSQLKINPNEKDFKIRIIKPEKGQRVKLKCFINNEDTFNDLKGQLTMELTKHKIISLNQIIGVESDINHSIIPFLVTECVPSNVINITNIDLEIDFETCFNYDNPIESLIMYFNF
jgi:hypothetical protein